MTFDISKIRPPYKSEFNYTPLSNEQLDAKYEPKEDSGHWGKENWGITAILHSMTTEYGRRTGSYGDFGRYIFQNALEDWRVNPSLLSNLAIEWIIEKYGYDTQKHGEFDADIGSGRGRDSIPNERIGKKYQWLALSEILARVSDNCPLYENNYSSDAKEILYEGTWNPYVRDIDPTILIRKTREDDELNPEKYWWIKGTNFQWYLPNKQWINYKKDLPDFGSFIYVTDEKGEDWLVLESHLDWQEPKQLGKDDWDYPRKHVWTQIRSYLVNKNDFKNLKTWAVKQNFMGRWMPESKDRYEVFDKEYYWSPAHRFFKTEYYGGNDKHDIYDKKSRKFISEIMVTTESYLWESEPDHSKEKAIRLLKPCAKIFDKMKMRYSENEGILFDDSSEKICFDTSVHYNSQQYLLIKKEPFIKFLNENNLEILCTIIGEKQIIGGHRRNSTDDIRGYVEYSGTYFLDNKNIKGEIKVVNNLSST